MLMQVNRQINQKSLRFKYRNIIKIFQAEKYRNAKNI